MTNDKSQIRAALAQKQILLTLVRDHPQMSDAEISALCDEGISSPAAKSYVAGGESSLSIREAIDHAMTSEVGRIIRSNGAAADAPEDHSAIVAGMTPLQMLTFAREKGLR